jgi:outer membrane immunogenic protein
MHGMGVSLRFSTLALQEVGWHAIPVFRVSVKCINLSGNVMSVAKFVRTGAAALGVFLIAHAAHAADYYNGGYKEPPPPAPAYYGAPPQVAVPFWQGFYVGGHIGMDWANIDAANNVVFIGGVSLPARMSVSSSGILGGMQAGYNFQFGNFLYGIEFDLGGMDIGGKRTFVDAVTPARAFTVSGAGGWYGDIAARGGFAYGNLLFYAKGGFAFFSGGEKIYDAFDGIYQDSGTFTGWTVGAGLEYMINPRWSIKGEYLYYDLGNNALSCCFGSTAGRFDNNLTMNTLKIGFNYIFHSGLAPLY